MKDKYGVGVDIGATWVRVAATDNSGNILVKDKQKIKADHKYDVSNQIAGIIRGLFEVKGMQMDALHGVGIASAGPMDRSRGELIDPTNIPLKHVPLSQPLEEEFAVKVELINDGASAVLAERKFGAGRGLDNLAYITISTGIGGGAIVDGNLLFGKNGNAAEVGHFTIDQAGKLVCGCGRAGHWEAYCSGSNIPNFVRMKLGELEGFTGRSELTDLSDEALGNFTAEDLYKMAKSGDDLAIDFVEEIGRLNAIGFAAVTEAYDPELITVGGAVALNNPDMVIDPVKRNIEDYTQNEIPDIKLTELKEEVVLYGAIATALSV